MTKPSAPTMEDNPFLTQPHHEKLANAGYNSKFKREEEDDGDEPDVSDSSECSEWSSKSHRDIEDSVREEMAKLEDTFQGLGLKYRMIDRIGEGNAARTLFERCLKFTD